MEMRCADLNLDIHQPVIWLPRDELGLADEAVHVARKRGIAITDEDSTISSDKGHITISRDTLPGNDFEEQ
jgi:hypothetical protein